MGARLVIEFRGGRRSIRGQSGDGNDFDATERLKDILVNDYDKAKQAYNALPTSEDKQKFIGIFEDMTEADFLMGAWRIEMVLDLIDDEQLAREKLDTLEQLINDYSIDTSNADQ